MRVERAEAADLGRILAVRRMAFAAQAPEAYSAREVETLLDDVDPAEILAMAEAGQLFVGRHDGDVVASAGWRQERLRHVYVSPAYQRRGFGLILLRRAEREFRAATGQDLIKAGVALHAEPFYRAAGYRLVQRATAWDGSAYLEMERPLSDVVA